MRNLYAQFTNEHNRFGVISFLLIVVSVLGGIAAGVCGDSLYGLVPVAIATMLTEAMILAVQPMKRIFAISTIACIVNIAVILIGSV